MQTIIGKHGDKPVTGKQGKKDQKEFYGQTKYSQVLPGTTINT